MRMKLRFFFSLHYLNVMYIQKISIFLKFIINLRKTLASKLGGGEGNFLLYAKVYGFDNFSYYLYEGYE